MRNADPTAIKAAIVTAVCVVLSTCNRLPAPGLSRLLDGSPPVATAAIR